MNILALPECMLEEIFGYLSYDEIAKKRIVSGWCYFDIFCLLRLVKPVDSFFNHEFENEKCNRLPKLRTHTFIIYLQKICSQVNKICQSLLNRGFSKMIKKHTVNLKKIKAQLPRRESERRYVLLVFL